MCAYPVGGPIEFVAQSSDHAVERDLKVRELLGRQPIERLLLHLR